MPIYHPFQGEIGDSSLFPSSLQRETKEKQFRNKMKNQKKDTGTNLTA